MAAAATKTITENEEPIREGATVRERQSIITIPDMTKMSVRVKIHESYIKKIKKGQKARITVDAFPDTVLDGEVTKVGVLPDSQNRWMNPDMKVYLTTITINGTNDWLKPGMSAKVEILANCLSDVVYVPGAGGFARRKANRFATWPAAASRNGAKWRSASSTTSSSKSRAGLRKESGFCCAAGWRRHRRRPTRNGNPPEQGKPAPHNPPLPPHRRTRLRRER